MSTCLPAYPSTTVKPEQTLRWLDEVEVPTCLPVYPPTTVEPGQTLRWSWSAYLPTRRSGEGCQWIYDLSCWCPTRQLHIHWTWSKLWSSRGHASKQYYDSNDPKGVYLNKKGKELLINKIMTTMYPDPQTTKRKSSSTHSPSADSNTKEQKLDNSPQHANTDLITLTDTQ